MKRTDTKAKIRSVSVALFMAVAAIWAIFYGIVSLYITGNTNRQMTQAAEQIIERLGGEFLQVEILLNRLIRNDGVKKLAAEQSPGAFYPLAGEIEGMLEAGVFTPGFIENIIIYGPDSHYYRLIGNLDNKSCTHLAGIISGSALPRHLTVPLEQQSYIGYADNIRLDGVNRLGAVAVLIEKEKILEVLRAYDRSGSFLVAISADGRIVAANTDNLNVFSADGNNHAVIHSRLGITPFEISVAADERDKSASVMFFSVVALIATATLGAVLYLYANILNKRFFQPMVKTIDSIESLDTEITTETLPHVQSEEFDGLIDKINAMLLKLETKSNETKHAELRAVTAEIEKQKALVVALKKQINAHLVNNTLDNVAWLINQGEYDKAQTVTGRLMALIQYAYDKNEYININAEWKMLDKYIFVMGIRYENLNVELEFDDRLMGYSMPRMLLQPLIENAVMHGFDELDAGSRILVKCELRGGAVFFTVSDNGCGMSAEKREALNEKLSARPEPTQGYMNVALLNIKDRLYHYFGDAGQVQIDSEAGKGTRVTISIPPIIKEAEAWINEE